MPRAVLDRREVGTVITCLHWKWLSEVKAAAEWQSVLAGALLLPLYV